MAFTPLQAVLQHLYATFTDAKNPVEGFLNVLSTVSPTFALVRGVIEGVMPAIQVTITTIWGVITEFWKNNGADIMATVQTTWAQIQGIINTAMPLIQGIITGVLAVIVGFIRDHGAQIQQVLGDAWTVIKNVIGGALTIIQGLLSAALAIFRGDWQGAWQAIQDMSVTVTQQIWNIIKAVLDTIAAFFGTSMADITKTWTDNWNMLVAIVSKVGEDMVAVGSQLVDGLKQGISAAWSGIKEWLHSLAMSLPEWFRAWWGISSPSRVAAEQIGVPFIQGIIQGIEDMIPDAIDAVGSVTKAMLAKADELQDKLADVLGKASANAFGDVADMNRQAAKNITAILGLGDGDIAAQAQAALKAAQAEADKLSPTNPDQAAAFFRLRSSQIIELAKLQQSLDEAKTDSERQALMAQMRLIQQAQEAEVAKFNANLATDKGPLAGLRDTIKGMLADAQAALEQANKDSLNKKLPDLQRRAAGDTIRHSSDAISALQTLLAQIPIGASAAPVAPLSFGPIGATTTSTTNAPVWAPTYNVQQAPGDRMDFATARALAGV